MGIWYNSCVANPDGPRGDATLTTVYDWADVRDLAYAHVTALGKGEAAGERIIISPNTSSCF
ncbi:hypothetical protein BDQ17DRAFT_1375250 [Cyathus striatus]|nr:hypothetical protein BDQ17DRAFT_1375250 [Cyathus striatus]